MTRACLKACRGSPLPRDGAVGSLAGKATGATAAALLLILLLTPTRSSQMIPYGTALPPHIVPTDRSSRAKYLLQHPSWELSMGDGGRAGRHKVSILHALLSSKSYKTKMLHKLAVLSFQLDTKHVEGQVELR